MKLYHFSESPLELKMDYPYKDRLHLDKPGGLWVSVGNAWHKWCHDEHFFLHHLAYKTEIKLHKYANILIIRGVRQLDNFHQKYKTPVMTDSEGINWIQLKKHYQGIIITPYLWLRRLNLLWYYTWDVASGVIWDLSAIKTVIPTRQYLNKRESNIL